MSDLLTHLLAQLGVEEGSRALPYDDATGKTLVKGMTLQGYITIATGVNLSAGLDAEEMTFLVSHRAQKFVDWLSQFAWYQSQDVVRQAALVDLTFNLGQGGLLHWPHFVSFMASHDYVHAAAEIAGNSTWISEVGQSRSGRIKSMIATGNWPGDIAVAA
jgi:GH24 family phage-related lysozyme (muramidase)